MAADRVVLVVLDRSAKIGRPKAGGFPSAFWLACFSGQYFAFIKGWCSFRLPKPKTQSVLTAAGRLKSGVKRKFVSRALGSLHRSWQVFGLLILIRIVFLEGGGKHQNCLLPSKGCEGRARVSPLPKSLRGIGFAAAAKSQGAQPPRCSVSWCSAHAHAEKPGDTRKRCSVD